MKQTNEMLNIRNTIFNRTDCLQFWIIHIERDSTGIIFYIYDHGIEFGIIDQFDELRTALFNPTYPTCHVQSLERNWGLNMSHDELSRNGDRSGGLVRSRV